MKPQRKRQAIRPHHLFGKEGENVRRFLTQFTTYSQGVSSLPKVRVQESSCAMGREVVGILSSIMACFKNVLKAWIALPCGEGISLVIRPNGT
jgi:hypothetical protein